MPPMLLLPRQTWHAGRRHIHVANVESLMVSQWIATMTTTVDRAQTQRERQMQ